ncbi:hypothetical protein [Erythrobacter mangrovi]|uniref:Uncharacterized protein n=1 Tax=Erythrobacter mangrovi TaxID=2739433 RepID=A0A7D4BG36_9SPHN|nr:hypothetical protein [Erythrobacter mangrovi]QKG71122.1 hypothetical protein HQR01_06870 [Erythrobacter mangrovi]
MLGTLRVTGKRWGILLLGVAIAAATIPIIATTLAGQWDKGLISRATVPNYNRFRLPERIDSAPSANSATGEVAQVIAESAEEAAPVNSAVPGSGAPAPTAAQQPPSAFIPIEFDILTPGVGDEAVGGEAIIVRKSVRMGQKEIGSLPVHVDTESRLLVDARDVRGLLEQADLSGTVRGSGLVSFSDLRRMGIDLRYDPTTDSVLLATR